MLPRLTISPPHHAVPMPPLSLRPGASAAVLGRARRGRPRAAGAADCGDRFRPDGASCFGRTAATHDWAALAGGPSRRRRCGWPIGRAAGDSRRGEAASTRRASAGGRRDRRAAHRRRAGEPARVRSSQGDVSDRAGVERVAAADSFGEGARRGAAVWRGRAGLHDDQPGHARRAGRVSGEHERFGLPEDDLVDLLPGHDAGGRRGDGQTAAGREGCAVPQPRRPRRHGRGAGGQRRDRAHAPPRRASTCFICRSTIRSRRSAMPSSSATTCSPSRS